MNQIDIEKTILGCFLIDPTIFPMWDGILAKNDFLGAKTAKIYEVMGELYGKRRVIDLITVQTALENKGELEEVGGIKYLAGCVESVPATRNLPEYVRIVKERGLRARILEIWETEKSPDAVIDKVLSLPRYQPIAERNFRELLEQTHNAAITNKGTAYKFNLRRLQKITGGLDKGEIMLIGGYTSQGKSAISVHLSIGFAEDGKSVLYCTSEMSEEEIVRRILANKARVSTYKFRAGYITESENNRIIDAKSEIKNWPYHIVRVSSVADIRREITKHNPEIVIVDHLHNLMSNAKSKFDGVTENITHLQNICLSEKIGMIVGAQLHRPPDKSKLKRPEINSFRSSGEIEEKATIVMMLWWQAKADGIVNRTFAKEPENYELRVNKMRDGGIGYSEVGFWPEYSAFEDKPEDVMVEKKVIQAEPPEDVPF
jgi:replicative DNA helicase